MKNNLLVPVAPSDIEPALPLPYSIYLPNRAPLAAQGQTFTDPARLEILRRQGWRLLAEDEAAPPTAIDPDTLDKTMEIPAGVRLAPRALAPLSEAEALIADDMPLSRKTLGRLLRGFGLSAQREVANGSEALTRFFQRPADLVFLDIDMPGPDGFQVLRQIKAWSPETFTCLVTGLPTVGNVRQAKADGVDAFLAKPLSGRSLERVLRLYPGAASAP